MMRGLVFLIAILSLLPTSSRCGMCYSTLEKVTTYKKACGIWKAFRCTRERITYSIKAECCPGWVGTNCDSALCNGEINGCSVSEGYVKLRTGEEYRSSGGKCFAPDSCIDCNPGYYVNGSYCRACVIDNCLHPNCTDESDTICKYCDGEVKEKYGWYAYTRFFPGDNHKKCRQACSWRPGSRCYPGTCSDELTSSCRCTEGFTGPDCNSVTEDPQIMQNFLRLTEVTDTTENHVEAPADSSKGSPQAFTWTNNARLDRFSAHVDASFKKDLPMPPEDFYVNLDQTKIGIVSGGINIQWTRGSSTVAENIRKECETEPMATNYRCQLTGTFSENNWHGTFKTNDTLKFTVFATNGGYVSVYNRENLNSNEKYTVSGRTKTYSFEVKFDTEQPKHCVLEDSACLSQPLVVADKSTEDKIPVRWSGWEDASSGLKSYQLEVFRLQPTGTDQDSELINGNRVQEVMMGEDTSEIMAVLPSPGPYSVTLTAYDHAGNHRTARRFVIYDDDSIVSVQGTRTYKADIDGSCIWNTFPSPPLVTNADPNAGCDWITKQSSAIDIAWHERYINEKHHYGKWLNPVRSLHDIASVLDDYDGERTTQKTDNVLGITAIQIAYNITFEHETTQHPFTVVDNIYAERFTATENILDGMKIDVKIRANDIFGSFAEDHVQVKVDMSPPIIDDLWLTKGDRRNMSVHNVEDFTKLHIEWKTYDSHSGIYEIYWRIFDNYTGSDIDHGKAYLPPQGDTKNRDHCTSLYNDYPRGPDCYCTPYDGCFHQHFQVKPEIHYGGTNGLHETKALGLHDRDYFIEVTATNYARLKTTKIVKITIDTSPPVPGSVHEGAVGQSEIDFQQEKTIKVHWNDFFDRESGILFYRYGYGSDCLQSVDFERGTVKDLHDTYTTEASFEVENEGRYYVTVAAYNHALDVSIPVCSDGVLIDSSVPAVSEFEVEGAKIDSRLVLDKNENLWFLHDDRTRQIARDCSVTCRSTAMTIIDEQLEMIPIRRNYKGLTESIRFSPIDDCTKYLTDKADVLSVIHSWKYIKLSWKTIESKSGIYDFAIGISSTKSNIPDIMEFTSSLHHTHLTVPHPNLNEGSIFYFIVKSISRSGVENVQNVGPFLLLSSPPTFSGEIKVKYHEDNGQDYLIASWNETAFSDVYGMVQLDYQFAVGTTKYGIDVHPFSSLYFIGSCRSTLPPTCTAISVRDLDWAIQYGKGYFITIRANNIAGLVTRASSKLYKHDKQAPTAGVVIDIDPNSLEMVKDNDDIDYQKSTAEMSGRWYGFEHSYSSITYTACITDNNDSVLNGSCTYVGTDTYVTLKGADLQPFQKYKILVIAQTDSMSVNSSSDGVTVIDSSTKLVHISVFDGEPCSGKTVSLKKEKAHYEQDLIRSCFDDINFQASVNKLSSYWLISEEWKLFVPDLYWHIEDRSPSVDYWTPKSEEIHTPSSSARLASNYPLTPGRSYRFGLKFCAAEICYKILYTNGVTVTPNPPRAGQISLSYSPNNNQVETVFEKYYDEDIQDLRKAQDAIDFYEWNIADNDILGHVVRKWTRIYNLVTVNETHVQFAVNLEKEIQFRKCWNLLLKGTNKAGISFTVAKNIRPCDDPSNVQANTVIDCVTDAKNIDGTAKTNFTGEPVKLRVNERWTKDDKDYTPYTNILSAVWPKLRYKTYEWAAIEIFNTDPIIYYAENPVLRSPCDSPASRACGVTDLNYVNIYFDAEPLLNGHRYVVCIHAEATVLEHEYWNEDLPEISVCSDGVTVDTTPPVPGNVWMFHRNTSYQSSNSEATVYWEKFMDIEELGNHVHESGISHYTVALGSYFGGIDVVPPINVGICSHHTFHDLKLQDGHRYFATVKGYDFTERHSARTSAAVIVDTTPPLKSNKEITIGKKFITNPSNIEACWPEVFSDPDSGMSAYKWGIGSRSGSDDQYPFKETYSTCSQVQQDEPLKLTDGHLYFITVLGFNNAGLFSVATSWAFSVDTTPPVKGFVNDGTRKFKDPAYDLDYQIERSRISAYWGGFFEPHTAIKEFLVSVGTSKGGSDLIATQAIGLVSDIVIDHIQLRDGTTYYVSITACNTADLCTTATSDGVLVDSSPPVPGKVIDGTGNKDQRYQASRNSIGAKWFGFTDPQSGLSHFTWRVGTIPFADNIVPAREVHLSEIAVIYDLKNTLNKQLPTRKMLFSTVRAYNKGGLYSESSSNGFMVDDTVPTFSMPLAHVAIGSLLPATSVLRSTIKVKWRVEDKDSFISTQYLSIAAHNGDDFNTSVKIGGFAREYTFSKLTLHDGSLYNVKLIACNGAKLCASSVFPNLLVDSSPPVAGTFAINTEHSVSQKLNRQPENWMTWESSKIHLAWLGFTDIHSRIQEYHIHIGSSFMAADLNENIGQSCIVMHKNTDEGNGFVQVEKIKTQPLTDYEHIFITMLAVNGVGLRSELIHSQFRLVPGGRLELLRRCNSHTCQGHCVCARQDQKCTVDAAAEKCIDKTGDETFSVVQMQDVISLSGNPEDSLAGFHTPTDMMLSAEWSHDSGVLPLWYEWSVGLADYDTPLGIFESHDRVWNDAGPLTSWTFTLPKGFSLLEGERYSFFVRAWFNKNTFADFKSEGVVVQISAPEVTSLFGKAVKEVRESSSNDIDFVAPGDQLFALWDGKFKNMEATVYRYRIFISTVPNGHDIYSDPDDIGPKVTRYNITGIYQEKYVRFFTNIVAYNHAGLYTTVSSDGCEIDSDSPVAGFVFDGLGYRDRNFQNSTSTVSASWQGFVDLGSSLRAYHWCVSPSDSIGSCSVLPLENIGLVTSIERKLKTPVKNGIKLISEVFATDLVGHKSATALSDGVVADETPPLSKQHEVYGKNLITNPSFEISSSTVNILDLKLTQSCQLNTPANWIISDNGCGVVVRAASDTVQEGSAFLALKGSISQTVAGLKTNSVYRLRFYTSHLPLDDAVKSNNEGFVECDDEKHLFMLYSKPQRPDMKSIQLFWHLHTFLFRPRQQESVIKIGSYENTIGFGVDNIQLEESITTDGQDGKEKTQGHVTIHTVFQHDWSSVYASWVFEDAESGIKEYLWAIGTVRGGIQLQEFRNIGQKMFASNSALYLSHNATIHVTVVAVNGAGLRTVSYSDPLRVDLTAPVFEFVSDGNGNVQEGDVDYQDSWRIGVNFKVADLESKIASCRWGIGIQPSDISLRQFEELAPGQTSAETTLKTTESFQKIFVVVRCTNNAGLTSTMSSDGVTIIQSKPVLGTLAVELFGQSPTQYLAHSNYHGRRDQLRLKITGTGEAQWIEKYKVSVMGQGHNITSYIFDYNPGYIHAKFSDLALKDDLYNISVTGINWMNMESDPVISSVTILTEPPEIKADITIRWDRSLEEVTISWADVFHSTSPMYYEVSAGSVRGSGDIIQWQETRSTELAFVLKESDIGLYGKSVFVVVRAITLSGTYITAQNDQLILLDDQL